MKRRKARQGMTLAAGGIVTRRGRRPLIAVVQRRKDKAWVLPKGKLKRHEKALAAARREVIEETGENIRVREFLGATSYWAGGKPKVVQFWRMQSTGGEPRKLMRDIRAVAWLPLKKAVARLSEPVERVFLREIGRQALKPRHKATAKSRASRKKARRRTRR